MAMSNTGNTGNAGFFKPVGERPGDRETNFVLERFYLHSGEEASIAICFDFFPQCLSAFVQRVKNRCHPRGSQVVNSEKLS
jgi:hypothetical protein